MPLSSPKYKGVGGWLFFFCPTLTVFSPLATIVSLIASYSEASQLSDSFPGMRAITVIVTFAIWSAYLNKFRAGEGYIRVMRLS